MDPQKSPKLNLLLLVLSLLVGLVLCEIIVRFVRPASDIFPAAPTEDPILGIRLLPFQSGHDANGFRNRTAAGYFPIVCIGDSMIYGVGVPRRDAIPQQLSRLLHEPVYSMGLGSYGPVQYYQLLKDSRKMHPKKTVIAFFLGNDLLDADHMVTQRPYWHKLAANLGDDKSLKDITPCVLPPGEKAVKYEYKPLNILTIRMKKPGSLLWRIHAFLRLHSGLYALWYEGGVKPLIERFVERPEQLKIPGVFHTSQVNTIFTPGVNLDALDPRDPKVRLGLLVTQKAVEMMSQLVKSPREHANLWFFIVPTKENVYYHYLKSRNVTLPPTYECAVQDERQVTRWLHHLINANGFRYIDVFPRMEQAANRGVLLYQPSSDAHPNIAGYRLIAQTVAEALKP